MSRKSKWQELILKLKDYGVDHIVVDYSGSGDSGGIDAVVFYDKTNELIKNEDLKDFSGEVEDCVYPLLNDIEDWYNNEGGNGTVTIDLENFEYHIENHINIVEQETYEHDGSISSLIEQSE